MDQRLIFAFQSEKVQENAFDTISGLACKSNRTLSFLAMDSLAYEIVAEKLGVNLNDFDHKTVAVIVDSEVSLQVMAEWCSFIQHANYPFQNESTYVLKNSVTTIKLMNFVYEFSTNKLSRHLRNSSDLTQSFYFNNIHHYNIQYYDGPTPVEKDAPTEQLPLGAKTVASVSLKEVHSGNFAQQVLESNKVRVGHSRDGFFQRVNLLHPFQTVAVLFYSTQCAFCTVFSSTLLTVSRILSDLSSLEFVRIDADQNDLPWQFTMETLPSFIIFSGSK